MRVKIHARCGSCGREAPMKVLPNQPRCTFCGGLLYDAQGAPIEHVQPPEDPREGWRTDEFPCPMCDRTVQPARLRRPLCPWCGAEVITALTGEKPALVATETLAFYAAISECGVFTPPGADALWQAALDLLGRDHLWAEESDTIRKGLAALRAWWRAEPDVRADSPLPPWDTLGVIEEFAFRGAQFPRMRISTATPALLLPVHQMPLMLERMLNMLGEAADIILGAMSGSPPPIDLPTPNSRDELPAARPEPAVVLGAAPAEGGATFVLYWRNSEGNVRPLTARGCEALRSRIGDRTARAARLIWFARAVYGLWVEPPHLGRIRTAALARRLGELGAPGALAEQFEQDRAALYALADA